MPVQGLVKGNQMTEQTAGRTGVWVESLYGDPDHGPDPDEIDASEAMDDLGLSDEGYKIVVYS